MSIMFFVYLCLKHAGKNSQSFMKLGEKCEHTHKQTNKQTHEIDKNIYIYVSEIFSPLAASVVAELLREETPAMVT